MNSDRYEVKVIQDGALPLQLDGRILPFIEHVCTVTIMWPEGTVPGPDNSLIVDPCFSRRGLQKATGRLQRLGATLDTIGWHFVTHGHPDHRPSIPGESSVPQWRRFLCHAGGSLKGIRCHSCPGHSPHLVSLRFDTKSGECWIVGDAVINEEWLTYWGYYWPNRYTQEEITQTWHTVADILTNADVVVPGHGAPFTVTTTLLEKTLANWPNARHCSLCPDVGVALQRRLEELNRRAK